MKIVARKFRIWGEIIGKSMKVFPFWLCVFISSLLFAIAHIAARNFGLVFYDVFTIFLIA